MDKPAYFLQGYNAEPCSGEVGRVAHWEQMLICSNGQAVFGYALTKDEAEAKAKTERDKLENELAQSPKEQIKSILARADKNDLYRTFSKEDTNKLLILICKILTE